MSTRHAYYKGLINEGPIFQLVSRAFDAIDDEWFELSKTCGKTLQKAASGGLFSASYPLIDVVSALYHPYMHTMPGLTKKQIAVLQFFRELCQYGGRSLLLPQRDPWEMPEPYQADLLIRLYRTVMKHEIEKYIVSYKTHRDSVIGEIMPLCANTDLYNPKRPCTKQEARNVWATDVVTGMVPIWGKFKHIRPVTKQAMHEFRSVMKHWSDTP